jgi:rubrerythrin
MIDIEALELALSKEMDAIKAYQELLLNHPNIKDLLYFLVNEEQKHKAMIEKKIVELRSKY